MSIIIDGHNLVPHIPGLSLSDLDDEQRLIEMVQEYCRIRRKQVELYFDNAPPGVVGMKQMGMVRVKFARKGRTADQDIKERLEKLGNAARNWVVVTSDQSVQLAVRSARAQVISAEEFARDIRNTLQNKGAKGKAVVDEPVSEDEIEQWLKIFQRGKQK